jgi:Ca2+-binding EF-hand superfamily protein
MEKVVHIPIQYESEQRKPNQVEEGARVQAPMAGLPLSQEYAQKSVNQGESQLPSSQKVSSQVPSMQNIPQNFDMRAKSIADMDFERSVNIPVQVAAQMWNTYDKNQNGLLEPEEAEAVAKEIFTKLVEEKNLLVNAFQHLFDEPSSQQIPQQELGVMQQSYFSAADKMRQNILHYSRDLISKLDRNRDGKVHKHEFVTKLGTYLSNLFKNEMISVYFKDYHPYHKHRKLQKPSKPTIRMENIDFEKTVNLTQQQVAELWNKYDVNGNGYLEQRELEPLAIELVRKFAEEQALVANTVNHMFCTPDEVGQEDKNYIDNHFREMFFRYLHNPRSLLNEIIHKFDDNLDRKVSKKEFMHHFSRWLVSKFDYEMHSVYF